MIQVDLDFSVVGSEGQGGPILGIVYTRKVGIFYCSFGKVRHGGASKTAFLCASF